MLDLARTKQILAKKYNDYQILCEKNLNSGVMCVLMVSEFVLQIAKQSGPNCMQKDTRWDSERDALKLLFDRERNELNGNKRNIFTPEEKFTDLAIFY